MTPERRVFATLFGLHLVLQIALWLSGSLFGSIVLECQVPTIARDALRFGDTPFSLLDTFDGWTFGNLVAGLLATPFVPLLGATSASAKGGVVIVQLISAWAVFRYLVTSCGLRPAGFALAAWLFAPPQLRYHAGIAGDYHGMAIGACFLAALATRRRISGGPSARADLACGGLLGGCLLLYPGNAPYVAALAAALLLGRVPPVSALRIATSGALALSPLIWKLAVHQPFGLPPSPTPWEGVLGSPQTPLADRAASLFVRDLPAGLGFIEALPPSWPFGAVWAIAVCWTVIALACWLPIAIRAAATSVRAIARRDRALAATLLDQAPACFAALFVMAYLASGQTFPRFGIVEYDLRAAPFLPPFLSALALSTGAAIAWAQARSRVAGRLAETLAVALALAGGLGAVSMIDRAGLREPRVRYRGVCAEPIGHFLGGYTRADHAGAARLCERLGEHGGACLRWAMVRLGTASEEAAIERLPPGLAGGNAASVGAAEEAPPAGGGDRVCRELPAGLSEWCAFGAGIARYDEAWVDQRWVAARRDPLVRAAETCRGRFVGALGDACVRGVGFRFADHQAYIADRLPIRAPPAWVSATDRREFLRSLGLVYGLVAPDGAAARCVGWNTYVTEGDAACRLGVADAGAPPIRSD